MNVQFESTINIGNVVTIIIGVITLTVAWVKLGGRMEMIEYRVKAIEDTLVIMAKAIEKFNSNENALKLVDYRVVAVETQFATLHETVEQLRRGDGWITSPPRSGIDGEYPKRD